MAKWDFSGWATRNDLKCADGRTIRKDAFKYQDGQEVPLVYNHNHADPDNILGHALLENRNEGVYAYCSFNDSPSGKAAKEIVKHGDLKSLSIFANNLKETVSRDVIHGVIREVSLVLAGANPGAFIDSVMIHGGDEDGIIVGYDENVMIYHSEEGEEMANEKKESNEKKETKEKKESEDIETVQDILDSMNEKQLNVTYVLIGKALEEIEGPDEGGDEDMKHNLFDQDNTVKDGGYLSHSAQEEIIALAKKPNVGSFRQALQVYEEEHGVELMHGIDSIEELFPEYRYTKPGAPEMITTDQTWIDAVLNKVHKSPISRIKTRQANITAETIRAMGYEKTKEKKLIGNIKLINRSTDPQTVYVKDKLDRDDIIDITDFDVVEYQRRVMRMALNEELAIAIMIGDGREEGDEGKISEDHIRSIWHDDELYTIHADVDLEATKDELQGTDTSKNFGENYIYAEAIISAALYAREKYKGSGSLDFYCTPHSLNVMLLARDLNGRRIYSSKADLAAALNVGAIHTVEQFEGKTRVTSVEDGGKTKKLLGLFVNLADYQLGSTKGGEITNFEDFDIDFNQYKYLMETRLSGAMTKVFSAIALEEDVTTAG